MLFDERVKKLKRADLLIGKIWGNNDVPIPTLTTTPTPTPTPATPTPTPTASSTPTVTPTVLDALVNCLSGEFTQELFGSSVALNFSGNVAVIGSPVGLSPSLKGRASVFEKTSSNWILLTSIEDETTGTSFGYRVDINATGDTVVVGAPGVSNTSFLAGFAKAFKFDGSNWVQIGQAIDGLNISDQAGFSVSINGAGDVIAVSLNANSEFNELAGQVRVYDYQISTDRWVLRGQPIFGTELVEGLGGSVSLNFNGDIVAIGSPPKTSFAVNAGQVQIFEYDGRYWHLKGAPIDYDIGVSSGDFCGWSVSLNGPGNRVAIGYPFADTPFGINSNAGQARVYEFVDSANSWSLIGNAINSTEIGSNAGYSVALNFAGDLVAVGAPASTAFGARVGSTRVYQELAGNWYTTSANFRGNTIYGNQKFGSAMDLNASGSILLVGAPEANLPLKNKTGTVCFSEIIVSLPVPTPTPSVTPTHTETPLPPCDLQQFFVNFQNSGYDVYRTCQYPITAVFVQNPRPIDFNSIEGKTITACMSALDYWSSVLANTDFPAADTADTIYTGTKWISNPLKNHKNKGLLLTIDLFQNPTSGVLGYAAITYKRRWSATVGTDSFNTPYEAFIALNTSYIAPEALEPNESGRSLEFYVVLHEIGHTLGIGTNWFDTYLDGFSNRKLYRSFIVGAGDDTPNPLGLGLSANLFYALNDYGLRLETNIGKPTTMSGYQSYVGDADIPFAFNGYHTKTQSKAVSAYNEVFGLSLTAIPVENGKGWGSFGGHWDEGVSYNPSYGWDDRAYYGNKFPGAPGLHDELMTPESENYKINSPVSKITLGALEDMGYVVDYSLADKFEPLTHTIKYNGDTNTPLCIDFNSFYDGNYCSLGRTSSYRTGKDILIRRGLTYTFKIDSAFGDPIKITSDEAGTTLITAGVTNNNAGTGSITYSVPTTLVPATSAWLFASNPSAKACMVIL